MRAFLLLSTVLVLSACSSGPPAPVRDAGHDAPIPPPDAYFGDTNAADSGPCASTPTSADVDAIFVPTCAVAACHSRRSPEPGGGLEFDRSTARAELVGMLSIYGTDNYLVIPGDVGHSFVWRKLTNDLAADGTEGAPMPQGDITHWVPLPSDQLETIRCWIAGGAP